MKLNWNWLSSFLEGLTDDGQMILTDNWQLTLTHSTTATTTKKNKTFSAFLIQKLMGQILTLV